MAYTLAQAATATGRDRSTLLKAIKNGKISAARDELTGAWQVDAAELTRVYGIGNSQDKSEPRLGDSETVTGDSRLLLEVERMKAAGLEARLADMERVNADLRRRLDAEAEERRRLTAILADQRAAPAPIRRWWRFGR